MNYISGAKTDAYATENENPEIALEEAITAHGDWTLETDGTLTIDSTLALRRIVLR